MLFLEMAKFLSLVDMVLLLVLLVRFLIPASAILRRKIHRIRIRINNKNKGKDMDMAAVKVWCSTPLPGPSHLSPDEAVEFLSEQVLLDAKRERIIMHFRQFNMLYAYYLSSDSWRCIDDNFGVENWPCYSVVVDEHDVLYYHHDRR